jgi:CHAT domain
VIYEDLDLRIQMSGRGFIVFAQRGTQTTFEPFVPVRLRSWDLEKLEHRGADEIKKLGAALFDALMPGTVRDLYHQGRGGSGSNAGKGLRIRILIDTREPRLQPFAKVPWEILYDHTADANPLLALDARRPIVRMIDSSEPPVAPATDEFRRVLLAWANPIDLERLDLDTECTRVNNALFRNKLRPDVLRQATRSELSNRIRDGKPQIVHFMGHGSFNSLRQEGALLLFGRKGAQDPLYASELATFFAGMTTPRLVILNACQTAAAGGPRMFNAFSSIAAALVAAGLPAVIAMQSTIGDANAITFTERLYRALLDHNPIEAAIADARVTLKGVDAYSLNWAVPVLYVRADGGGAVAPVQPERPQSDRSQSHLPTQNQETFKTVIKKANKVFIGPRTVNRLGQKE